MKPEDDIHFENELKKLKLQAEHGMIFAGQIGDGVVPPEVMRDFLNSVEAFENQFKNAKQITIGEFLGNPVWRAEKDIPDDEIAAELQAALQQIEAMGIRLAVLHPSEERDVYKFIAEEFMREEIDDIRIVGFTQNFIYEEYYPNHREDVKSRATDFLQYFFDRNRDEYDAWNFTAAMQADSSWRNFREAFDRFEVLEHALTSVLVDGESGVVTFNTRFVGRLHGEPEGIVFEGKGTMELTYADEWWQIAALKLPGRG